MIIESNKYRVNINFDSIEYLGEGKDGKLNIVYYLPGDSGKGASFTKKNETFECCENEEIIKVYKEIRA